MKRRLGFGIIGIGNISNFHARCIEQIENCELKAICSRSEAKAKKAAQEYRVPYYINFVDLIHRDDIDAISICMPSGMHLEPALVASQAGKHIIMEKPIEITLDRADQIIHACQQANVKLSVIFQHRFDEAAQKLKKAVRQEQLGRLILGDAYVKWHRTQEYYEKGGWRGTLKGDGGGALINQSIHTIDLLQWIMGPVKTVYGKVGTFSHKIEGEDLGLALLTFENGAMGVIEGSTSTYPGFSERLEIHGENGTVILEGGEVKTWEIQGKKEQSEKFTLKEKTGGASDPMAISIEGHLAQYRDFIDAIENDREPLVNGIEGRKALEIVRAIYQSSNEGRMVQL
ncbi:Gfo/Idh/MocA family oxidoreductase [candidate division KSB1 bacterium]|nr:Gfo/Idh/MocA family oxidoreductase [candidate division KSB1 bacterium]